MKNWTIFAVSSISHFKESEETNMADTPFNMSFDDLIASMEKNGEQVSQPNTVQGTAASEPAPAPEAGMSFDEMVAQAQKAAAGAASTEPPKTETEEKAVSDTGTGMSFDEMVAKAQAAAQMSTSTAKAEESKAEESKAEESKAEESKADGVEGVMNPPEEAADTPATPAEGKQTAKSSRKKKSKAKEEKKPEVEKPEDKTEDYRVDILGDGHTGPSKEDVKTSMEVLFSPEEVKAIRADIRAFVRRELKMAMVDAMKELVQDFGRESV